MHVQFASWLVPRMNGGMLLRKACKQGLLVARVILCPALGLCSAAGGCCNSAMVQALPPCMGRRVNGRCAHLREACSSACVIAWLRCRRPSRCVSLPAP